MNKKVDMLLEQQSSFHTVTEKDFAQEISIALKEFFFGSFSSKDNSILASLANGETFKVTVEKI